MSAVGRFAVADRLQLAFVDSGGPGTPVLCLAGLTRNMADFAPVAERLGGRRRIIRLDSRGRGASDWDPDVMNYTVPVEAQDALALLDHLEIPRAIILGTSRGGLLAMTIAVIAKDRLAGVLLNDIGPEVDPKGLEAISAYLGRPPSYASYAEAAAGQAAALAEMFPTVTPEEWRRAVEAIYVETDAGLELRYDPGLREAVLANTPETPPDLWPLFAALEGVPLALLRGANSNLLSAETAARMRTARPDMLFAEVPDRGHVPFLTEPESIALIDRFLDATP
ncbi:MAG: alpha/beta hydrolase [Pseudomonadota bacterium]